MWYERHLLVMLLLFRFRRAGSFMNHKACIADFMDVTHKYIVRTIDHTLNQISPDAEDGT